MESSIEHKFPWLHTRHFNSYSEYFKREFGKRVQKVSINAGFTCPNRDGTLDVGGCIYCNNEAFNPSYCQSRKTVTQQIEEGIEFHKVRYRRAENFLAYFQTYSNTYDSIDKLKKIFDEALSYPAVVGLVIGTRPDCIDEQKLEYLARLSEKYYIILEYGLESCYNKSLQYINRGHTFEQSVQAIELTAQYGIKTGAHIIFGLPTETRDEMLAQAEILSQLPLNNIKFHQLQIIENTRLADEYAENPGYFNLFSLEEYIDFIVRFIERFNPNIVIERFVSEAPPRFQIGKTWGNLRIDQVMNLIEKCLEERDTWQGKFYLKTI